MLLRVVVVVKVEKIYFPWEMSLWVVIPSNENEIGYHFADYFETFYTVTNIIGNNSTCNGNCNNFSQSIINNLKLSENWIIEHNGLPAYFFYKCFFRLATPISIIFDPSLKSGIFPDSWKISYLPPNRISHLISVSWK